MQEGKSPEAAGQALDLLGSMFPFLADLGRQTPASGSGSCMKLDALSASADRQRVGAQAFQPTPTAPCWVCCITSAPPFNTAHALSMLYWGTFVRCWVRAGGLLSWLCHANMLSRRLCLLRTRHCGSCVGILASRVP